MEKKLYSAVISDALDEIGVRDHTANPCIRPLNPKMVVAGRAATLLGSAVYEVPEKPYEMVIEALDRLKPDDVVFVAAEKVDAAIWGELLSTASRAREARGAIVDGVTRDVDKIMRMNYPVFCTGITPTDSKGRADIIQYGTTVRSGDTEVRQGDMVFADLDGVVVIPRELEKDVLKLSFEKASKENVVRDDLLRGKLLREAWEKHGIL
jgi:regulator of RNase E activity RraA